MRAAGLDVIRVRIIVNRLFTLAEISIIEDLNNSNEHIRCQDENLPEQAICSHN